MSFEIVRTQGTLPGRAAAVRANIDVDVGGQLMGRAIAGLGRALIQEGLRYDLIEADTQFTEAKRLSKQEINRLAISFRTNLDPSTYQAELDKSKGVINGYAPKNRRAARAFGGWVQDRTPDWESSVEESRFLRIDDNYETEGWKLRQEAIEGGTFTIYQLHLWKGRKLGVYSGEQAEVYMQNALKDRKRYAELEQAKQKVFAKEALEAQYEIDRDKLGKALQDGTIDYSMINGTSLPEKEQESYRLKMLAEYDRRAKGIALEINHDVKDRLTQMAWDIPSGTADIKDFKKEVEQAYKNDDIDAKIRSELLTLGETKYAPYFANAMSKRESYAKGQLVDLPTEYDLNERLKLLTSSFEREQTASLRKLQLANWDRYKTALREWFEKSVNKDPSAGKIYQDSQEILMDYKLTPDQLREGMLEVPSRDVFTPERAKAVADIFMGKLPPENPYKKDYPDAFFEDGFWKVIRNGRKYRIED